ncbi:unnamed protein product [Paramecium primaurelia]|uniref:Uncharacterized protein n=1 Tax=Paramecium primaurelia TaxID=5886 RepID=A0A8S1M5T1_PARPR|nr:unnamed protein product [Paramecium primaurelia]
MHNIFKTTPREIKKQIKQICRNEKQGRISISPRMKFENNIFDNHESNVILFHNR